MRDPGLRGCDSGRGALALEHAEAPRYRLFKAGEPDTLAFTDPRAEPQRLDEVAFASQAWEALNAPHHVGAGAFWVAADPAALAALDRAGMLRFAFWDLERRLEQGAALAVLRVRSTPLGPGSDHLSLVEDPEATGPGLAAVSIEVAERALRFPEFAPCAGCPFQARRVIGRARAWQASWDHMQGPERAAMKARQGVATLV